MSDASHLVLPLEIVAQMRSADYAVPMCRILPLGYLTPGSLTNDRQYRISELAEDIRQRGIQLPLRVWMGRGEPLVNDGHHRYAAAEIAGVATVPVKLISPGELDEVLAWVSAHQISFA